MAATSAAPATPLRDNTDPASGMRGIDGEVFGIGTLAEGAGPAVDYAGVSLTRRTFPDGGSALLPSGWVFADQTLPSDHSDLIYYDPTNLTARFELSASGCVGCVTNDGRDPAGVPTPPAATTSSFVFADGHDAGFAERPWLGYAVNGVVGILHASTGQPEGYVLYRVALPPGNMALATRILDGVVFPNFTVGTG